MKGQGLSTGTPDSSPLACLPACRKGKASLSGRDISGGAVSFLVGPGTLLESPLIPPGGRDQFPPDGMALLALDTAMDTGVGPPCLFLGAGTCLGCLYCGQVRCQKEQFLSEFVILGGQVRRPLRALGWTPFPSALPVCSASTLVLLWSAFTEHFIPGPSINLEASHGIFIWVYGIHFRSPGGGGSDSCTSTHK